MIEKKIQELIAVEVIKILYSRFLSFPDDTSNVRNAPFHLTFLKAFEIRLREKNISEISYLINLSSWLHGLNTSLGQSFFEKTGAILSGGAKKNFTKTSDHRLSITELQKKEISTIITELKNQDKLPNVNEENNRLRKTIDNDEIIEANDFTVDIFIQDDSEITCIEMKSVRPNAGEMRGEKQKILEAKAALMRSYPDKKINFFFGFPFDPTSKYETGYDKQSFLDSLIDGKKYIDKNEFLIASELWDFLSGESNTMEYILHIINSIATPEFKDFFNYLNNIENRSEDDYEEKLSNWFLFSEIELLPIIRKLESLNIPSRIKRKIKQEMFEVNDNGCDYRISRVHEFSNYKLSEKENN